MYTYSILLFCVLWVAFLSACKTNGIHLGTIFICAQYFFLFDLFWTFQNTESTLTKYRKHTHKVQTSRIITQMKYKCIDIQF